jgi:acetoin utilization deacetylase AcuC-like enzyme
MAKYAMIRDGVVARGLIPAAGIEEPSPVDLEALRLVHEERYIESVRDGTLSEVEMRRLGFRWQPLVAERSLRTVQGTLEAARHALDHGAGINLAGGTHHAYPDHGEGYCVFNDAAVAIRVLQRDGRITRAAVVDLDVHQGNGTAFTFRDDADVFTFSMHGAKNYPFRKESSSRDVELPDGCDDARYLEQLALELETALEASRPELVIYLAGADPYRGDRLGRLALTLEGLAARDRMVFAACRRHDLPVVMVLGGGYAADLEDVVTIHANTVKELLDYYG